MYNDAHQTTLELQTDAWEADEPPVLLSLQEMDGDKSDSSKGIQGRVRSWNRIRLSATLTGLHLKR